MYCDNYPNTFMTTTLLLSFIPKIKLLLFTMYVSENSTNTFMTTYLTTAFYAENGISH